LFLPNTVPAKSSIAPRFATFIVSPPISSYALPSALPMCPNTSPSLQSSDARLYPAYTPYFAASPVRRLSVPRRHILHQSGFKFTILSKSIIFSLYCS
jgi:hypothetical protein